MKPLTSDTDPPLGAASADRVARNTEPGLGERRRVETDAERELREVRERIAADPAALAALAALREAQEKDRPLVVPISALEEAREEDEKRERARRRAVPTAVAAPGSEIERAESTIDDPTAQPEEVLLELPGTAATDTTVRGPALRVGAESSVDPAPGRARRRGLVIALLLVAAGGALVAWLVSRSPGPDTSSGASPSASSAPQSSDAPSQTAEPPSMRSSDAPLAVTSPTPTVPRSGEPTATLKPSVTAPAPSAPNTSTPKPTTATPTTPTPTTTVPYILEDDP